MFLKMLFCCETTSNDVILLPVAFLPLNFWKFTSANFTVRITKIDRWVGREWFERRGRKRKEKKMKKRGRGRRRRKRRRGGGRCGLIGGAGKLLEATPSLTPSFTLPLIDKERRLAKNMINSLAYI